jgi:hypothetical protein
MDSKVFRRIEKQKPNKTKKRKEQTNREQQQQ